MSNQPHVHPTTQTDPQVREQLLNDNHCPDCPTEDLKSGFCSCCKKQWKE